MRSFFVRSVVALASSPKIFLYGEGVRRPCIVRGMDGQRLVPPIQGIHHPLIRAVRKGLDDEVVEVGEAECPIHCAPLIHGRESNIGLGDEGCQRGDEIDNWIYLKSGICDHLSGDTGDVVLCQEVLAALALCFRTVPSVDPVCLDSGIVTEDSKGNLGKRGSQAIVDCSLGGVVVGVSLPVQGHGHGKGHSSCPFRSIRRVHRRGRLAIPRRSMTNRGLRCPETLQ